MVITQQPAAGSSGVQDWGQPSATEAIRACSAACCYCLAAVPPAGCLALNQRMPLCSKKVKRPPSCRSSTPLISLRGKAYRAGTVSRIDQPAGQRTRCRHSQRGLISLRGSAHGAGTVSEGVAGGHGMYSNAGVPGHAHAQVEPASARYPTRRGQREQQPQVQGRT